MNKIIELTEEQVVRPKQRRLKVALFFFFLKAGFLIAGAMSFSRLVTMGENYAQAQGAKIWDTIAAQFSVVKVVAEMSEKTPATLDAVISQVSREEGLDPRILRVVAVKESAEGRHLYNFEPALFQRLIVKHRNKFAEDEVRMLSSSHGIFHLLGETARTECSLHWSKLYDPLTNARCSARYLRRLWDSNSGIKDSGDRLWQMFKSYNGSGANAEAYANNAMKLLGGMLYAGAVKNERRG